MHGLLSSQQSDHTVDKRLRDDQLQNTDIFTPAGSQGTSQAVSQPLQTAVHTDNAVAQHALAPHASHARRQPDTAAGEIQLI